MTPTSISALREEFRKAILAVSPTFDRYQDLPWAYVHRPADAKGGSPRTFTLSATPGVAEDPGTAVYGGGISYEYTQEVLVNYGALPIEDDEQIIDEDARDLWTALLSVQSTVSGLIDVEAPEWETDPDAQDGNIFGSYVFNVRYFGRN